MTKEQLYLKAVQVDPNNWKFCYDLLCIMQNEGRSIIRLPDGFTMTIQQLLLKLVQLDPNFYHYYNWLGETLPNGDSIRLLDGTIMTKQQLLNKH
jgi:hypothetical protein